MTLLIKWFWHHLWVGWRLQHLIKTFAPDVADSKYIACLCLNPIRRLFKRHNNTFLVHRDWHQIKSFQVIPAESFCCYSVVQFIAVLKNTMNTVWNNFPPSRIFHLGFHDFYTATKIQRNGPKEIKTDNKSQGCYGNVIGKRYFV